MIHVTPKGVERVARVYCDCLNNYDLKEYFDLIRVNYDYNKYNFLFYFNDRNFNNKSLIKRIHNAIKIFTSKNINICFHFDKEQIEKICSLFLLSKEVDLDKKDVDEFNVINEISSNIFQEALLYKIDNLSVYAVFVMRINDKKCVLNNFEFKIEINKNFTNLNSIKKIIYYILNMNNNSFFFVLEKEEMIELIKTFQKTLIKYKP